MNAPLPANFALLGEYANNPDAAFAEMVRTGKLPKGAVGLTEDGTVMFRGDALFNLKATHGFPLDFALDRIINQEGMAVDWVAYIQAARENGRWDYQSYEDICHAMVDAEIPRAMQNEIRQRFRRYVVRHPHSGLAETTQ